MYCYTVLSVWFDYFNYFAFLRLVDLEPITKLVNLERLSLMDNPVTKVEGSKTHCTP